MNKQNNNKTDFIPSFKLNSDEDTILHIASENNNINFEILELLFEYNCDPMKTNIIDYAPFHKIFRNKKNSMKIIDLFMKNGSEKNATSAFFSAENPIFDPQIMDFILPQDVNVVDTNGTNILETYYFEDLNKLNINVFKYFVEKGQK